MGEGVFLKGEGSFWNRNGGFRVEVGGGMWTHEKSHRESARILTESNLLLLTLARWV